MTPSIKKKDSPSLSSFKWDDPLLLDSSLSEDETMLAESARKFAQDVLHRKVISTYANETTDPGIFREMGDMRLLGTTISEEYGGLGAGYVSYGLIALEIERVDSG